MKLLGIDYGSKKVGVAISDEEGMMAFPRYVLQNDSRLVEKISKICDTEKITEVVLGRSLNYKGQPNNIMEKIVEFKEELEKEKNIKVHLENEFLTSAEAARIQGNVEMLDASAAALILRSFMEKEND